MQEVENAATDAILLQVDLRNPARPSISWLEIMQVQMAVTRKVPRHREWLP